MKSAESSCRFRTWTSLRADARAEGIRFIECLSEEWASGANRFDAPGEMLCGRLEDGLLVAIGG